MAAGAAGGANTALASGARDCGDESESLTPGACYQAGQAVPLQVAVNGTALVPINLPPGTAQGSPLYDSAEELRQYLDRITGASFVITSSNA
jgi:hypothetical protein